MNRKIFANTLLTLVIGAPVFLGLIPYGIFYFSCLLDNRNGFSPFFTTTGWKIFAVLLMLTGFYFALSSIILMIKNMGIPTSVAPKGHLMTGGVYIPCHAIQWLLVRYCFMRGLQYIYNPFPPC